MSWVRIPSVTQGNPLQHSVARDFLFGAVCFFNGINCIMLIDILAEIIGESAYFQDRRTMVSTTNIRRFEERRNQCVAPKYLQHHTC